jgi:hypothetical protein
MERGSSKHSQHLDDEMAREAEPYTRGGPAGSRLDDWRDPEAPGEDQVGSQWIPEGPRPGGAPGPLTGEELEARSQLGRAVPRSAFPADRGGLIRAMAEVGTSPQVRARLERLPADRVFHTVYEIWEALGGRNEG